MNKTITIATSALGAFNALIKRLAKLATKFSLSPVPSAVIDWTTKREVKTTRHTLITGDGEESESTANYLTEVVDANLTLPEAVQAQGWRLVGVLDRTDEGLESTATAAADLAILETFRTANTSVCHHCNTKRIRNRLVIVQKGDQLLQVGRECAHNYLTDVAQAIGELEFQAIICSSFSLEGEDFYGSTGAGSGVLRAYPIEDALAEIVVHIRTYGFAKSRIANRYGEEDINLSATWRKVEAILSGLDIRNLHNTASCPLPSQQDHDTATHLATWISGVDAEGDEFLIALKDLVSTGFVSRKKLGLLASLPGAWERWTVKQAELALPKPTTPAPEGRCEVAGTILTIKEGENDFGHFCKLLIRLEDFNKVWVSCPSALSAVKGEAVRIVATFTRSPDDEHFSFGKRPTLPKPPKAKKIKGVTPLALIAA